MLKSLTINLGRVDSFVRVEIAVHRLCWQSLPQVSPLALSIKAMCRYRASALGKTERFKLMLDSQDFEASRATAVARVDARTKRVSSLRERYGLEVLKWELLSLNSEQGKAEEGKWGWWRSSRDTAAADALTMQLRQVHG